MPLDVFDGNPNFKTVATATGTTHAQFVFIGEAELYFAFNFDLSLNPISNSVLDDFPHASRPVLGAQFTNIGTSFGNPHRNRIGTFTEPVFEKCCTMNVITDLVDYVHFWVIGIPQPLHGGLMYGEERFRATVLLLLLVSTQKSDMPPSRMHW